MDKNFFKKFWQTGLILVGCLLLLLINFDNVKAAGFACDDGEAKWNKDYNDWPHTEETFVMGDFKEFIRSWGNMQTFECRKVGNSQSKDNRKYTYVTKNDVIEQALYCEGNNDYENSCPSGEYCTREPDCESTLGGVCVQDGTPGAPEQENVDCQTGITKDKYSFYVGKKKYDKMNWQIVRFRCPAYNGMTCWVPIPNPPPEEIPEPETPTFEKTSITTSTPKPNAAIRISDCCRQIVPEIDPNKEEYTLNHVVQTAINVYECILCIVGALILIMLIFGSFMIMISGGNDARVAGGKKIISAAIVGGLIVFFSYLIVNFTVKALGAQFVSENKVQINPQGPSY